MAVRQSEQEYVLSRFAASFAEMKGQRIFLYGCGPYTEQIIRRFDDDFAFCGVIADTEEYAGKRCFPLDCDEVREADVIILSEHKPTGEADFHACSGFCEDNGIRLFDMYGLDELQVHAELASHVYQNPEGWQRIAAPYDVVSFAAVETLTMRDQINETGLRVRPVFLNLIRWLKSQGKKAVFMDRPACPYEVMEKTLRLAGVIEPDEDAHDVLFMRAGEDLGFRTVREKYPGRILHIGISTGNDGVIPRFYGIDTYRVVMAGQWVLDNMLPQAYMFDTYTAETETQLNREDILQVAQKADVVSFDIFDTLLIRYVPAPEDVFALVERRTYPEGAPYDYVSLRRKYQRELYCADLDEIYRHIREASGIPEAEAERVKQSELACEKHLLTGRKPVIDLLEEIRSAGKKIVLTSDMYLDEKQLQEILAAQGITGYERIFVSCDQRTDKRHGLYEKVKEYAGEQASVLHIGDDPEADLLCAEENGIKGLLIPSVRTLAGRRGWHKALAAAKTAEEKTALGIAMAAAFSDPFAPVQMKDLPETERYRRYAGSAAAVMILAYLQNLRIYADDVNADRILFAARDGYILNTVYGMLYPDDERACYFETSRHASFLAACDDPEVQGILIRMRDKAEAAANALEVACDADTTGELICRHAEVIRMRALRERGNYRQYLNNSGLDQCRKAVFCDFVSTGTSQMFLHRFVPFDITGYYFARPYYAYETGEEIAYCFNSKADRTFTDNYVEMECIMSSPDASLIGFDEAGNARRAKENRTPAQLHLLSLMHAEVRKFVSLYLDICGNDGVIRPEFAEILYAADGYHNIMHEVYDDWTQKSW